MILFIYFNTSCYFMSCLYNFLPLPFMPFINLSKFSFPDFKDVTIPLTEDYAF